ncbi:MAG: ribosome biogenesis GTPase YlqF [Finegoldia sp.]|nr:ribosome biogenesis GTPase YlqF [Finegoldia sp.]
MDLDHINWYPGHMKKSLDTIKASLKLVDIVLILVDSRIVRSSINPLLDQIIGDKKRLILLNKTDLADPKNTDEWIKYFEDQGYFALGIDSKNGKNLNKIKEYSKKILSDEFKKREEKNIRSKTIRMMIVGIPNVGKSTLINKLSKRQSAKVGNTPGLTRSNQWIRLSGDMELLDTPGVLWPKFEDNEIGLNLAFTGAIKDNILDEENLAYRLIEKLMSLDKKILEDAYGIESDGKETIEIMDDIARRRGAIKKKNEVDYFKVATILLDDFRKARLGRISLESVRD